MYVYIEMYLVSDVCTLGVFWELSRSVGHKGYSDSVVQWFSGSSGAKERETSTLFSLLV